MRSIFSYFTSRFPYFTTYTAFALLFCLIPYRILGILHFGIVVKVFFFFFCFFVFYYVLKTDKEALALIFESMILQYFFFTLLRFENLIWNMSPFLRYFFLFCFGFNLGAWPSQSADPAFYYMLFFFVYTFYNQLKVLFLNPNFEASTYCSSGYENENAKNLTWEDIMRNISSISLCFFGRPISSQLGKGAGSVVFPHITKRYVVTRILGAAKSNPELLTAATALGGFVGYSVSEFNQERRHGQTVAEAKRANDLKEVELGLKSPEEYKSTYGVNQPNQEGQTQNLTASIDTKAEPVNPSCSYESTYSSIFFKYLDCFF